jgi:hypothetical protein
MSEQDFETVLLTDEEGSDIPFRLIGRLEWQGETYAFLEDPEDEGSVMVFTVTEDGEGEQYEPVLDDELCEEVFYLFQAEADDYEVGPAE